MMTAMRCAKVAALVMLVMVGGLQAAAAKEPGSCGQYKHWRDGECVDARDGGKKTWLESMQSQSKWW